MRVARKAFVGDDGRAEFAKVKLMSIALAPQSVSRQTSPGSAPSAKLRMHSRIETSDASRRAALPYPRQRSANECLPHLELEENPRSCAAGLKCRNTSSTVG